jgi:hypothetical protein|tara:strand:- start:4 stop:534 length:531 start_codon:yes stop_codon:yes gene_type:complete
VHHTIGVDEISASLVLDVVLRAHVVVVFVEFIVGGHGGGAIERIVRRATGSSLARAEGRGTNTVSTAFVGAFVGVSASRVERTSTNDDVGRWRWHRQCAPRLVVVMSTTKKQRAFKIRAKDFDVRRRRARCARAEASARGGAIVSSIARKTSRRGNARSSREWERARSSEAVNALD